MATPVKTTIDWYDKEAHVRFANDQKLYEKKYVEEAKWIPNHTEITVTTPTQSQYDTLLETDKGHVAWGFFEEPENFKQQSNRFFKLDILPNIDIADVLEVFEQKMDQAIKTLEGTYQRGVKTVMALLECLVSLSEMLVRIVAERLQFQKG